MSEFKDLKDNELRKKLDEFREKLRLFRFGVAGSKVKNVKEGKNLRRDIARILTEMRDRIKN